ncbi:hypothetical protein NIES806_46540 [Dolichospermum compactum NIES-806]|uniref:Uncharacterized protein n=1 Tax=Dolichospermum compactum NIES-806 TaxID=1973481 RepID=A0A1Z4VA21_9CYAN|nr:hypothetical protein NIES806_46540 [Dolichospermum compactum NIES-806]
MDENGTNSISDKVSDASNIELLFPQENSKFAKLNFCTSFLQMFYREFVLYLLGLTQLAQAMVRLRCTERLKTKPLT